MLLSTHTSSPPPLYPFDRVCLGMNLACPRVRETGTYLAKERDRRAGVCMIRVYVYDTLYHCVTVLLC